MEKAKLANAVSAAGRSLLEILWEELDAVLDRLAADGKPDDVPPVPKVGNQRPLAAWRDEWMAYGEERGKAQSLAYAIAVITNPYKPDVPAIKRMAAVRLEERQT
jgi:hypothetical protein